MTILALFGRRLRVVATLAAMASFVWSPLEALDETPPGGALAALTGDRLTPQLDRQNEIALAEELIFGAGSAAELKRGEELLANRVAEGDPKAMFALGSIYLKGTAIQGKAQRGAELLQQAGESGIVDAFVLLGEAYLWGSNELPADAERARSSLEKAAAAESTDGLRLLGEQLIGGWVLSPNPARGEKMLQKLVSANDAGAKLALGRAYVDGRAIKNKGKTGIRLLGEAAKSGLSDAYAVLGNTYLWGSEAVSADPKKAADFLEQAAASGNVEGSRSLGEQLIGGWTLPADPVRGEAILQKLSDGGDAGAKLALGRAYIEAAGIKGKTQQGIELLDALGGSGVPEAFAVLGNTYLWGSGEIKADATKASQYLEKAAAANNVNGLRSLGEQLVVGWVLKPDPARGELILERLVADGDVKAMAVLGRILFNGEGLPLDKARARQFLEWASQQEGDAAAAEILGNDLLWSATSKREQKLAQQYLIKAAKGGRSKAWFALAQGATFGKFGDSGNKDYPTYEGRARQAGIGAIEILVAQRRMWGIGEERDLNKAIETLEVAAGNKNADALTYLVTLFRDGDGGEIEPDKKRARSYLRKYGTALPKDALRQEQLLIDVAGSRSHDAIVSLASEIRQDQSTNNVDFLKRVFRANPNLSVYLAQTAMLNSKIYDGPLNGMATAATIAAVKKACSGALAGVVCSGPILGDGVLPQIAIR